MNIGEIISAFDVLQQQVTSPVQQLRKEIDLMQFLNFHGMKRNTLNQI